jgi:hypothetical protein
MQVAENLPNVRPIPRAFLRKILTAPALSYVYTERRSEDAQKKCGHESNIASELPSSVSAES